MGLFSFKKNVGTKIFEVEKIPMLVAIETGIEKFEFENSAAKKLERIIESFQLRVEDLNIFIDTDVAVVSGLAYDQATKEKVVLVIGNSNGIATVDDYMTVENEKPDAQFYTVTKGDTLEKIAKMYYGNTKEYSIIFKANKPMLNHPNDIYTGLVLRIPA